MSTATTPTHPKRNKGAENVNDNSNAVAWRNGNHIYCMNESWAQVISEPVFLSEKELPWLRERKCAWCNERKWK